MPLFFSKISFSLSTQWCDYQVSTLFIILPTFFNSFCWLASLLCWTPERQHYLPKNKQQNRMNEIRINCWRWCQWSSNKSQQVWLYHHIWKLHCKIMRVYFSNSLSEFCFTSSLDRFPWVLRNTFYLWRDRHCTMTSISNEIKTMNVVVQVLLGFLVHFLSAGVDLPHPIHTYCQEYGKGGWGGGGQ